jgi:hypothetical protein
VIVADLLSLWMMRALSDPEGVGRPSGSSVLEQPFVAAKINPSTQDGAGQVMNRVAVVLLACVAFDAVYFCEALCPLGRCHGRSIPSIRIAPQDHLCFHTDTLLGRAITRAFATVITGEFWEMHDTLPFWAGRSLPG